MTTRHCKAGGHEVPQDQFRYPASSTCRACDAKRRRDERAAMRTAPPADADLVRINNAAACWFGPVDREHPLRSAA